MENEQEQIQFRFANIMILSKNVNELKALQDMLENNNSEALEKAFFQARDIREDWLKNRG